MTQIEQAIVDMRESMQDDLISMLEGLDDALLNSVCDMIVERCNNLLIMVENVEE